MFQRFGDSWTNTAKLAASDGAPGDGLGSSVGIDGDTIVAGAPGEAIGANRGQGAIYTFAATGAAVRSEAAKLTTADGGAGDNLGTSVAIDGETIVSGAPGHLVGAHGGQGAVYTFASAGPAARTQTAELTASDGAASDLLGASVAIDGDTIVAGAPTDDGGGRGSAYTFSRTGASSRTETAKLIPSDSQVLRLGSSVEIDGDTIVVGAPGTNNAQGSVYTFARTGPAARTETAQLTASDAASNASLGTSVAIDAATIVAGGALSAAGPTVPAGAVYTFARAGVRARTETGKLTDPAGAPGDSLGQSIAIDAGTAVAGAPGDDVGTNLDQGSASVFFQPLPPPRRLRLRLLRLHPPRSWFCRISRSPRTDSGREPRWRRGLRRGRAPRSGSRSPESRPSSSASREPRPAAGSPQPADRYAAQTAHEPRCTRHITIGSFTVQARAGANSLPFTGVLAGMRLAPGSYKLTATPTDSAHNNGQPRTVQLTITAT